MTAVDTNILVYAYLGGVPNHDRAWEALRSLVRSNKQWTVPWPCIGEFIAVATNRRLFDNALSAGEAATAVAGWLGSSSFVQLSEGPAHWSLLSKLIQDLNRTGPRVYDLRIAVLCVEHGVGELLTADRDLVGVPDLKIRNPLLD